MPFFDLHTHQSPSLFAIFNASIDGEIINNPFSIGIHPATINEEHFEKQLVQLEHFLKDKNCVALGECGLDKRSSQTMELQEKVFQKQIQLANDYQKPLIIHSVQSHQECSKLLEGATVPVIFHGFNNKLSIAASLITKGYALSFGAALFNNESTINTFLHCENFFLETDNSNIPIEAIYERAAQIKGVSLENLKAFMAQQFLTTFDCYEWEKIGKNEQS